MKEERLKGFFAGLFILTAYGVLASLFIDSKVLVAVLESLSGIAVIAISIILFPYLKPWSNNITNVYLIAKVIEGVLMIIAAVFFVTESVLLLDIRDWINVSHAYFFIAASALLYYLMYISKIVPRFISVWGFIALVSLLIGNILEVAGITHPMVKLFYPLIMLNEIFLAVWFMVKGIKKQ